MKGLVLAAPSMFLALAGCRTPSDEAPQHEREPVKRPIDTVLADHSRELMAILGVVIVFVGAQQDGTPCITVGVSKRSQEVERSIPRMLEGHPVVIQETGPLGPR